MEVKLLSPNETPWTSREEKGNQDPTVHFDFPKALSKVHLAAVFKEIKQLYNQKQGSHMDK